MTKPEESMDDEKIIARITNKDDPDQVIAIQYQREKNAFVTSGIVANLGVKEFLIPVHLVALDLELIGTIISAILEKISKAHETETTFDVVSTFEVLGKTYTFTEEGNYMKIEEAL